VKKPVAVKIENEDDYNIVIEALGLAGFKWGNFPDMSLSDVGPYHPSEDYIFVSPEDHSFGDKMSCVYDHTGPWKFLTENFDILPIKDFVEFFSQMTEDNVCEFLNLYKEEL